MPESLCSVASGVARNVPVIVLQALFSLDPPFLHGTTCSTEGNSQLLSSKEQQ